MPFQLGESILCWMSTWVSQDCLGLSAEVEALTAPRIPHLLQAFSGPKLKRDSRVP